MEKFKNIIEMVCNIIETVALVAGTGFVIWFIWNLMPLLITFD